MTPDDGAGLDLREPSLWDSRRLWSLWDMLRFKPSIFLSVANGIGVVEQDCRGPHADNVRDSKTRKTDIRVVRQWRSDFASLNLRMCVAQIDRLIGRLKDKTLKNRELASLCEDLSKRMVDECSINHFFFLSDEEKNLYEPSSPLFGKETERQFPTAAFEIDEAGKCLALGRYTACVFHLMRVMEIAINATGSCLQIPAPMRDADRNWGEILRKMKVEMDRRNGMKPAVWPKPDDRDFFADAYASLDAVRVAWRNTTMHVENKYNPDEAGHIFGAVRGFMRKVASRFDENGDPKA